MTNYVIISDLHLDEYEGRLDKYIALAEELVKICQSHNTNELIIAGDIINRSVTTPKVVSTLNTIIMMFKSNGIRISYLLGQHDYNQKDIDGSNLTETYLGLLDMDYIGGTHRRVEGLDIHFRDFERTNKVVSDECDVLIAHVSLGFQDIDQSKFKLAICGDIHKPIQIGNAISISPPMQIHPSEPQEGYYVLLSMDNGTFNYSRVQLPTIFTMPKPQRIKDIEVVREQVDVRTQVKIPETIAQDITLDDLPKPIDMNFSLIRLDIENFRSIKKKHVDFDSRVINIRGANGTGKSTILWALYYAFVYKRGLDYTKLEVEFSYGDSTWIISRGENKIYKNGTEIKLKSKTDFEDKIKDLFPFVELLEFFNVYTYKHFFDCDRIRLFEELFNLKGYAHITSKTKELKKKYESEKSDLALKIANINGQIFSIGSEIQDLSYMNRNEIAARLDTLKSWNDKLTTLRSMKIKNDTYIESLRKSLSIKLEPEDDLKADQQLHIKRDSLISSISKLKSKIILCPKCGTKINGGNIEELEKELSELPNTKYEFNFINRQLALYENRLKEVQDLNSYEAQAEKINNRITELEGRLQGDEILELSTKLANYDQNERWRAKLDSLNKELQALKSNDTKYDEKIKACDDLLEKIDIKNPNSIPVKKIEELTKDIETDEIKFSVLSELKNGNSKLDIQVIYNNIDYDNCSHGEKALLDLHLIRSITRSLGMVGFIILDESLCTLSPANYEIAGEIIQEINAYNILITSHQEGFNKYDKEIVLEKG